MKEGEELMPDLAESSPELAPAEPKLESGNESLGDISKNLAEGTERGRQLLKPIVEALESGDPAKILSFTNELYGKEVTDDPEEARRRLNLNRTILETNISQNESLLKIVQQTSFLVDLRKIEKP